MTGLFPMKRTRDVPPQRAMMTALALCLHPKQKCYLLEVFSGSCVPRLPGGDSDSRPSQFMDTMSPAEVHHLSFL